MRTDEAVQSRPEHRSPRAGRFDGRVGRLVDATREAKHGEIVDLAEDRARARSTATRTWSRSPRCAGRPRPEGDALVDADLRGPEGVAAGLSTTG